MSKQISASKAEGIPTPEKVTQPSGLEKATQAKRISSTLDNNATSVLEAGSETLTQLNALLKCISDIANDTTTPGMALVHIRHLAELGRYASAEMSSHLECMAVSLRDEHIPAIVEEVLRGAA